MRNHGCLSVTLPRAFYLMLLALLLFSAQTVSATDNPGVKDETANALKTLIAGKHNPLLSSPDFSPLADQLAALYRQTGYQLLWLPPGRNRTAVEQGLAMIAQAAGDGLDPRYYDAEPLRKNLAQADSIPAGAVQQQAEFDTAFSIAFLRYANDLHFGRVSPQQLDDPHTFGKNRTLDIPALLAQAIEHQTLNKLPEQLRPKFKQYRQLQNVLAAYRKLPKEANREALLFSTSLHPFETHPQMALLRQRLIQAGAMSPQSLAEDTLYSEALQQGVKNFQQQNGLLADGIIGTETAAKLNETVQQKILQIELALERLRWLPDDIDGPLIIVNIPAFQLWAFNDNDDSEPLTLKVIVGKALQNQTPVLFEKMRYLEFMPYWNIPQSILDKEILPKLYEDIGYLESQDIELVERSENDADSWDSVFEDLKSGRVRARQRPGKNNPLGKVKFVFPNKEDVYLHDTSSPRLFERSRRDFSHGCVRVAQADKLAEFVLKNQPDSAWNNEDILQAMSDSKTRRVPLKNPIPVLFIYSTSFVDQQGQVHFYRDIYQQDPVLLKALDKNLDQSGQNLLSAKTQG